MIIINIVFVCQVDQSAVEKLRDAIQGPDYKEKLGGIVSQLYKLAFQTYHDIPRGPIKVEPSTDSRTAFPPTFKFCFLKVA